MEKFPVFAFGDHLLLDLFDFFEVLIRFIRFVQDAVLFLFYVHASETIFASGSVPTVIKIRRVHNPEAVIDVVARIHRHGVPAEFAVVEVVNIATVFIAVDFIVAVNDVFTLVDVKRADDVFAVVDEVAGDVFVADSAHGDRRRLLLQFFELLAKLVQVFLIAWIEF